MEIVSDLYYKFCSFVNISVNQMLTEYVNFVQWHRDFFTGGVQSTLHCRHFLKKGTWCIGTAIFFLGVSNNQSSSKKKYGPLVQWFWKKSKVSSNWESLSTEIFEINMHFEYGLDEYLFWMMSEALYYI